MVHWNDVDRNKLLFWFVQVVIWSRFLGSTESIIDKDLEALTSEDCGLDKLLDQLRLWQGTFRVESEHFGGHSLGALFYPVLYMLTRIGEAKDWGEEGGGIAAKSQYARQNEQAQRTSHLPKSSTVQL